MTAARTAALISTALLACGGGEDQAADQPPPIDCAALEAVAVPTGNEYLLPPECQRVTLPPSPTPTNRM